MSLERIRPTHAALFQYVKITLLVSSFIWGKCRQREINLQSPAEYGWEWNERLKTWLPFLTNLDDASYANPSSDIFFITATRVLHTWLRQMPFCYFFL